MRNTPVEAVEVFNLKMADGTGEMLFARGVLAPDDFLHACLQRGYDPGPEYRHLVQHERFCELWRNPNTGRFQRWFEPVEGEPNATVLYFT